MTVPESSGAMTGRERIKAAFSMKTPDRVPKFDQTVTMEVASAVMGREMLTGGGTLRFREVQARFESDQAGQDFVGKMMEDLVTFYREMGYDMTRLPWRDRRKASRKLDEWTYQFGDPESEGPWETYHYDEATCNWHQAGGWLAGGDVDKLIAWLEKETAG